MAGRWPGPHPCEVAGDVTFFQQRQEESLLVLAEYNGRKVLIGSKAVRLGASGEGGARGLTTARCWRSVRPSLAEFAECAQQHVEGTHLGVSLVEVLVHALKFLRPVILAHAVEPLQTYKNPNHTGSTNTTNDIQTK